MNRHATVLQAESVTPQNDKSATQVYGHQPEMLRYLTEQCNFHPYTLMAFDDRAFITSGEPIALYLVDSRWSHGHLSIIESKMMLFFDEEACQWTMECGHIFGQWPYELLMDATINDVQRVLNTTSGEQTISELIYLSQLRSKGATLGALKHWQKTDPFSFYNAFVRSLNIDSSQTLTPECFLMAASQWLRLFLACDPHDSEKLNLLVDIHLARKALSDLIIEQAPLMDIQAQTMTLTSLTQTHPAMQGILLTLITMTSILGKEK